MVALTLIPTAISIVGQFFPSLLGRIAGKRAEEIAQKVVNTAAGIAGVSPQASVNEIIERLAGSTEAQAQLRLSLAQIEHETYEMELEDRQRARDSQEKRGARRGNLMLVAVVIGLLACIYAVTKGFAPENNGSLALVTTIAGALLKMFSDAFAFEFGSSRGSKEKDDQINAFKQDLVRFSEGQQNAANEAARTLAKAAASERLMSASGTSSSEAASQVTPKTRDFVAEMERAAMA